MIYDIEREPMWQEKWIDEALAAVFDIVERQHITALGLPLLGTGHGSMHPARVAHLLARALGRSSPASLQRLWVPSQRHRCGAGPHAARQPVPPVISNQLVKNADFR